VTLLFRLHACNEISGPFFKKKKYFRPPHHRGNVTVPAPHDCYPLSVAGHNRLISWPVAQLQGDATWPSRSSTTKVEEKGLHQTSGSKITVSPLPNAVTPLYPGYCLCRLCSNFAQSRATKLSPSNTNTGSSPQQQQQQTTIS